MNNKYIKESIEQSQIAYKNNEIPIGCVIVKDDEIISKAYNKVEKKKDPTAHAEILAIKKASKKLNNWRLADCDIYVNLQPCDMCLGAIMNARLRKLYFAAYNEKSGSEKLSSIKPFEEVIIKSSNHKLTVVGGINKEEIETNLKSFFTSLRKMNKTSVID